MSYRVWIYLPKAGRLNLSAEGWGVEEVEVMQLHSIHKCLLHFTKNQQPNKQSDQHETNAIPETPDIKTAHTKDGITKDFHQLCKWVQRNPES